MTRLKDSETIAGSERPEESTTSTLLPGPNAGRLFLFVHVKRMLQGTEFQNAEEPLEAVIQIVSEFHMRD
jgi:hypothetical protein